MALFSFGNSNPTWTGQPVASASAASAGHVAGSLKKNVLAAWFFTAIWNLISWPLFYVMFHASQRGNRSVMMPEIIMSLFPLVGVALLIWAIRQTLQWQKYGDPALDIDFVPIPVGGRFQGRITLQKQPGPMPSFALTLSCIHRVVTGSGKSRSVSETILYHDDQTASAQPGGIIPISFDIPPDAQETDQTNSSDSILWRLRATGAFPGIPFIEQYDVPVGRPLSLPPEQAALVLKSTAAYQAKIEHYQRPADSRIYVRATPDGKTEFFFSAGRNRRMIVVVGIILCVLLVLFGVIHRGVFSYAILAIGLGLAYAQAMLLFGTTSVTIGAGEVVIRNAMLGFNMGTTTIPAADVVEFKTSIGSSYSSNGGNQTTYYDITVVCRDGESKAGGGMADKMEAEALAAQMGRCLLGKV
jgi:hypothetical protein